MGSDGNVLTTIKTTPIHHSYLRAKRQPFLSLAPLVACPAAATELAAVEVFDESTASLTAVEKDIGSESAAVITVAESTASPAAAAALSPTSVAAAAASPPPSEVAGGGAEGCSAREGGTSGGDRERGTPDAIMIEAAVAYMEEAGGPKGVFGCMSKARPTWKENGCVRNIFLHNSHFMGSNIHAYLAFLW